MNKNVVVSRFILIAVVLFVIMISGCAVDNNSSLSPSPSTVSTPPTPSSTPNVTATATPKATQTPEPSPSPLTARLIAAGDCVIHDDLQKAAKVDGEDRYDFSHMFEPIKPFVQDADYGIISFEGAATNNRDNYAGFPYFNCPPELFDAFKDTGFNLVNLSNNHQLDRRVKGMLETRDNIINRGLDAIGTYDGEEIRYLIKDINGIKVGFMSYTYGSNGNEALLTSAEIAKHLAFFDKSRMEKEIRELEEKADITVVAMHWGHEYWRKPNEQQISLANDLFEWGADIILGSHPHVIQHNEIRTIDGEVKYINYAMGNFLTNQWHEWFDDPNDKKWLREDGMLINIDIMKDPETDKTIITNVTHIPTWVSREVVDGKMIHKILPIPSRDYYKPGDLSEEILKKAYESYERTIEYITDY